MTSAYDAVFDEDLPGFLFVKTQFWEKGQLDVPVYLRRRTIEGDWMWLETKGLSMIYDPIPGITVREVIVKDEGLARRVNRITRIAAILVQGVEAAMLGDAKSGGPLDDSGNSCNSQSPYEILPQPTEIIEDAVAYKSLIASISTPSANGDAADEALRSLVEIAASGGAAAYGSSGESSLEKELRDNLAATARKKAFDPMSMIESVRQGVRIDFGLIRLYQSEVKLITLVLSGKLSANEVAPILCQSLFTGQSLQAALSSYSLDSERHSPRQQLSGRGSAVADRSSRRSPVPLAVGVLHPPAPEMAPPLSVVNLAYTYIGNTGMEMLSEILYCDKSALRTIDVSFCKIEEKGLLALARALQKRKRKRLSPLLGVFLSGNYISVRAAAEIGLALSSDTDEQSKRPRKKRTRTLASAGGYNSDSESDDDDEEDFGSSRRRYKRPAAPKSRSSDEESALHVLHVANASLKASALRRLLEGLGPKCSVRELNLSSNMFGARGASVLVDFLEGHPKSDTPMPRLDRLDLSNNNLGDKGTTLLTRAISKRLEVHLVDLKLSSNAIGSGGIETIMNKLLQHNLVSLSLDKNSIGDQGCQLVAASLQSMTSLARLNLSFNQIGSRGIISLMRTLVGCESITYLGLSGNILRISGAIALAFTLAQHPRLEEVDLDNCCLGQAAQCHLAAGIISNRWVPMKRLNGFAVGPPMVAIGALKPYAQSLSNEECFRIRKDEQMKTILQWMEYNRISSKQPGESRPALDPRIAAAVGSDNESRKFLNPEFVDTINEIHGTPSQSAYFRLLGWLSRIPFDDDELTALQKYFYDPDGGEGDRGSDGYINLKLRGDLLAALDSEAAGEIREDLPSMLPTIKGSIGVDLEKLQQSSEWDGWKALRGEIADPPPVYEVMDEECGESDSGTGAPLDDTSWRDEATMRRLSHSREVSIMRKSFPEDSAKASARENSKRANKIKPRITMFPQFERQLEELKAAATEMIEQEDDPLQHEVILTQYAEASLTILRQLRYHCMNSGLDGWRQAGLKRKVLVIDDSTVARKLVSRAFERANFIVDTATNGAEGVEKLKASIYDIAFMDIDMPVMNGFEATKKLREWEDKMRPGTRQPICALTAAYVDDFERSELMKFKEAGLDVMESKPCNIPRLFKVVDDVSPMFSDLSISVIQRERSDTSLSHARQSDADASV
jgi:CheY-like chemotaxis protein